MATKPFKFSALRACLMQSDQSLMLEVWKRLFAAADAFLETILPNLLRISLSFVIPPVVFSLFPRMTCARASLPFAILLTRLAFMLLAPFMAGAFIGRAMPAIQEKRWARMWASSRARKATLTH